MSLSDEIARSPIESLVVLILGGLMSLVNFLLRREVKRIDDSLANAQKEINDLKQNRVMKVDVDELRDSMVASINNAFHRIENQIQTTAADTEKRTDEMHEENRETSRDIQGHLRRQDEIARIHTEALGDIKAKIAVLEENKRVRERSEDRRS